ncbi:response regulator receiver modulated diguanylate cyclase/phosphodiesterase [[Leptolyngbya] sp. PCC 7376]|uniref:EAL domain-containing response regulator n=1 Tax=[Leptolyngbya] sp. PCC 7376 TaxID=111781 RepID=UPI00029ED4AA|nr:EAL domain-containing protein [[Leptolyngbya] sp. PCC 7376]AFY37537.1 response regulator receiver modulated diguanylate cyclase/phosphodiesterase [[Leptolyngbya] sp. PCC 7376]
MVKILVVEDDAKIRKNMARLLKLEDHDVLVAENGLEGLDKALSERPDLILCDILMPELDGHEMLQRLKEKAPNYFAPFIFVTAKGSKEDIRQGMTLGADDYLTKPFTRIELLDAVSSRLEKQNAFQKHYQEQLEKIEVEHLDKKKFDPVTGLPNILYLQENFKLLICEYESLRFGHSTNTVLLPFFVLRVERTEIIKQNVTLVAYQQLLKTIAQRISDFLQDENSLIMLNDIEFVILSPPQEKRAAIIAIADSIIQLFERSFTVDNQEYFLQPKLGVSLYCRDAYSINDLIQKSLNAVDAIDDISDIKYHFYSLEFSLSAQKKAFIESELHYAVERNQIKVHYQPSIRLRTGQIVGVEALARWHHPELGMISPFDFIPLTEQIGLINEIGLRVLEIAAKDVRQWQQNYQPELRLAVNFSGNQLHSANICHDVMKILMQNDFSPSYLDIEITESVLIQDFKQAIAKLNSLQRLGCRIAMDDFGTGYSSLNYARMIPWDILKIDRSFISDIHLNQINSTIVKNVISAANDLGFEIIAEGVEIEAELAILKEYHCDQAQGYLFSKPISFKAFTDQFFRSNFIIS